MTAVEWAGPRWPRAASRLLAVLLVALIAVLITLHRTYQAAEIVLAGALTRMLTSSGVYVVAERETFYFGLGSDSPFGLRMTPECSSVFLVLPLLAIGAVMITLRPPVVRRVLGALLIATLAVVMVNQLRVITMVGLVDWLGTDRGYYWGHTLLGSMVSVLGGACALVLFVWLSTRPQRRTGRHAGEEFR